MNYVKKGLVPKYMGKITEVQWKEFVQQKTDHKALAISNEYAEMSKKNIYLHHMGSKGYVAKIPKWKKKIEEAVSAGLELTQDGKLVHKKKRVAAVQEKQYNSLKRKDWVSSSLTGRMTFLVELLATLNTLDTFVASLLRCRGKLVFHMMVGATRSVIDIRETLKI
jgi:hypothetical protein